MLASRIIVKRPSTARATAIMSAPIFGSLPRRLNRSFPIAIGLAVAIALCGFAEERIPLNELGANNFHGHIGGLYEEGSNVPPESHRKRLAASTALIQPLDVDGQAAADGKIVLIGIGASVCRQIFDELESMSSSQADISKAVVIVNGALGGADVNKIAAEPYWLKVEQVLRAHRVSNKQVQVVWYQSDDLRDQRDDFPGRPQRLANSFADQMKILAEKFPNVRLCYHSGRHTTAFMPNDEGKVKHAEPRPYYHGWATKWLIESKDNGANGPLSTWAGYFWTNGEQPRRDGYTWNRDDNVPDGVHLSNSGRKKVAGDLIAFWKSDEFARRWFLENASHPSDSSSVPSAVPFSELSTKKALGPSIEKPQVRAAKALKPDEPALLINGKSKLAKLERLLNVTTPVRLVVYDPSDQRQLLVVENVFHQRLHLNERLGPGRYRLEFCDQDGNVLPMTKAVPDIVTLK